MDKLKILEHIAQALIELTEGLHDDVCIGLDRALRDISDAIRDQQSSEDQLSLDLKLDEQRYDYDRDDY